VCQVGKYLKVQRRSNHPTNLELLVGLRKNERHLDGLTMRPEKGVISREVSQDTSKLKAANPVDLGHLRPLFLVQQPG